MNKKPKINNYNFNIQIQFKIFKNLNRSSSQTSEEKRIYPIIKFILIIKINNYQKIK